MSVCTSCGVMLKTAFISHKASYSELDNYGPPPRAAADKCPLIDIIVEKHPGCVTVARSLVSSMEEPLAKGLMSNEHPRFAQALAYIAYRTDGHSANICDLARQVNAPVERLRKDIKRLSDRLGIASSVSPLMASDSDDHLDSSRRCHGFQTGGRDVSSSLEPSERVGPARGE